MGCLSGMYRRLLVFILLLTAVGADGWARVSFSPELLDIGRVGQHASFERTVQVTNTGAAPLEILSVEPDCSCTLVIPEKRVLAAGESTPMKVVVESRSYQGEVIRRIKLSTSAGDEILMVKMNIAPLGDWNIAAYPIMFTRSQRKAEARLGVRLSPAEPGQPVTTLVSAETGAAWLEAEIVPVGNPGGYELKLLRKAGAPAGMLKTEVRIHTASPDHAALVIPVFAPVASATRVSPNPLTLPRVRVGETAEAVFRVIAWEGENPPTLRLEGAEIAATESGDGYRVTLRVRREGVETRVLRIDDGEVRVLETPVIVQGMP